jgi:hypothetical protein
MIVPVTQHACYLLAVNARPIWGRFDHERPSFDSTHLWTLVSVAALLIAIAIVVYRSSQRRKQEFTHHSPRRLFRDLCRAHRLPLRSRQLLKRLAFAHGVKEPETLFVNSSYFDAANLPASLRPAADEIRTLHNRLF